MPIFSPPAVARACHYQHSDSGAVGQESPICVSGEPCFRWYGQVAGEDPPAGAFLEGGWFNTGDLGNIDKDGYIYITGRSKEVNNRGGEIISPMEVEEAVLSHPAVTGCAAFSVQHDILVQELLVSSLSCHRIIVDWTCYPSTSTLATSWQLQSGLSVLCL
jgi:acyl-CoA synthetase (AMP-forming)/AMP-acid ligase II